jgi:thiol-disulfide isomerase/thioredoxin
MDRRWYLLIAGILAFVALGAVVFAAATPPSSVGSGTVSGNGSAAPALAAKGWINSPPLTPADLNGKVVVYDFWTYSCVNCVRTIPYVRSWYDRYRDDGLVVIGVHSPEFDFEKDHDNVAAAVKKLGVDYPVALDDDMTIWDAFLNQYWPADYIYGRDGKSASKHFGEGDYDQTEDELRTLLGVRPSSPRAVVNGSEGGSASSTNLTQETYNGSERGDTRYGSNESLENGTRTFTVREPLNNDEHALSGPWTVADEYVESAAPGSVLLLRYTAGQVNLVMSTATAQPIDAQVQVDDRAPATVHVDAADLYALVADTSVGTHTLRLTAAAPGLRAFAFTFGG